MATGLVVDQIWRYPVKSMGGEPLVTAPVGPLGIEGDRAWGVVDVGTGRVLTGRRQPELLLARARHLGPGHVAIGLPDGTELDARSEGDDGDRARTDAALSAWLGRAVALVPAADAGSHAFEVPDPDETGWRQAGTAEGAWHDSARTRLSLVSRTSVGDWDARRFRSNVLLRGGGEDALVGGTVHLGPVVVDVTKAIRRCVMVNRPLPGLEADRSVLRTILDERGGTIAIGATIVAPGPLAVGDAVRRDPAAG